VQRLLLLRRKKVEGQKRCRRKLLQPGVAVLVQKMVSAAPEMICALVAKEYTRREATKP